MAGSEGRAADSELSPSDLLHLNVGGWAFSLPAAALARSGDSVLWRDFSRFPLTDDRRVFLDRDGSVFRLVHLFLVTSQLSASCMSELDVLCEQTRALCLQPMIEALEKCKEEAPNLLHQIPPGTSGPEKVSTSYRKTRKFSSRLSELSVKSSPSLGDRDKAPLGLFDKPFLDVQEDVPYWFLPIDLLETYPELVTDDNLLWFSETFALIECGCQDVRFIGNFLHTGKFFFPEKFSDFEVLEAEIQSLGIPGLLQALHAEKKSLGYAGGSPQTAPSSSNNTAGRKGEPHTAMKPFYILALELLAKYPDSALGQLRIESSVDGSKLYIIGTGTLFLHVRNWMGTCRLPLTRSFLEIYGLCLYLDRGDAVYQPMREAVRSYLKSRTSVGAGDSWPSDVRAFPSHQTVRVYVRTHWYATYLKTLLKYPELLQNSRKTRWISCGSSLLVNGDGDMFRHILNFLRLGSLYLPSEFGEWDLLSQEVTEFQIPSLVQALYSCPAYRLWMSGRVCTGPAEDPAPEVTDGISSTNPQDLDRAQMDRDTQQNPPAGSRWLPRHKLKGPSTSPDVNLTDSLPHSSKIGDCTESTADSISCLIKQVSEIGLKTSPRNKRPIVTSQEGNTLTQQSGHSRGLCSDTEYGGSGYRGKMKPDCPTLMGVTPGFILVCEATEQKLLGHHNYSKLSYSHPKPDNTTACAGAPGDLGAILWVQHRLLLTTDGSATAFQDSVIYTSEMDIPACAEGTAEDLFFLTFNMTHKEIWYGRQCHSCLTTIILDCIRHEAPKHLLCKVVRLVSMYWIGAQPAGAGGEAPVGQHGDTGTFFVLLLFSLVHL
ncbi:BTB/POZ domain-containing protein KCTD19 isoform X2 [Dendrobates tinctorius]|uniref:BTB/POZ domain-containing protein KCTD19 isoform X2 n=1 Tax=Dendrobates tinctorius TaxID=92724 RepID=UPI003CC92CE1